MALLLVVQASWLTSCNDDMAAENYYTFTGEMMSDFLNNREDFSLFRRIVERSGNMSLLSARGTSTFFPATNAGVEAFLTEMGYGSVEDIPEVYCDTLVKASFIEDRVLYTYNMEAVQQIDNALELPLIITTSDTLVDEDGVPLSTRPSVVPSWSKTARTSKFTLRRCAARTWWKPWANSVMWPTRNGKMTIPSSAPASRAVVCSTNPK